MMIAASWNRTEVPDLDKFTMHTQDCYEIYCFLDGDADYFVEGTVYTLRSGDILILKKAEAHSLLIKSLVPYERIAVHFSPDTVLGFRAPMLLEFLDSRPLGKFNRYPASMFRNNWIYYLKQICTYKDYYPRQVYITTLLWELYENYHKITGLDTADRDPITDVIGYINDRLTEKLSLEQLCDRFFMSKAQLNRRFKKATGSTVWEYIMAKRLLLAKERLQAGVPPTTACTQSGFNDYCAFYRAYKAKFGNSPKADQLRKK